MPGGRPLKLLSLVTILDADGKPTRKRVLDAICDSMAATGMTATQAGPTIGPPRDTVSMWLNEGRKLSDHAERLPPDWQPQTRREQVYLEFFRAQRAAHMRFVHDRLALHSQSARGGLLTGKVVETIDPTRTERDPETGAQRPVVLNRRAEHIRTLPDARALEWELEHLAREEYVDDDGRIRVRRMFAPRVEVGIVEGDQPAESSEEAKARALLAEIDAYEAGMSDRAALADEQEEAAP